ncbi:MAG: hypothetical protein LBK13_13720, partial [Spirochaetales bacterium]|nr:hypothetical protein [Spirochaetales bacterium]
METTIKTPEEKAKEAEAKAAQEMAEKTAKEDVIFAKNPKLDVYYRTSDGLPFFTRNAADMHA